MSIKRVPGLLLTGLLVKMVLGFPTPQLPFAPEGYNCLKTESAPIIDGLLEDPAWEAATWSNDFTDIEGKLKPSPYYRTRMKMLWDDEALYIAADLEEEHLWASYDQHDMVIYHENDFEVFLDPDGDNHDYFELELNALETTWDLYLTRPYRDNGDALDQWEMKGLRLAVNLRGSLNDPGDTDDGWTVELAIPWPALEQGGHMPMPPQVNDVWRMNYSRVHYDLDVVDSKYHKRVDETGRPLPEYNWVWSPQGLIAMHYPERWGLVRFCLEATEDLPQPSVVIEAEHALMQIYYQQREFQEHHGRFASSGDLLEQPLFPAGWEGVARVTGSSRRFEAIVSGPLLELSVDEQGHLSRWELKE